MALGGLILQVGQLSAPYVAGFLGSWLHAAPTRCICQTVNAVDSEILRVLERQLERCGPEHVGPASPLAWGSLACAGGGAAGGGDDGRGAQGRVVHSLVGRGSQRPVPAAARAPTAAADAEETQRARDALNFFFGDETHCERYVQPLHITESAIWVPEREAHRLTLVS